MNKSQTNSSTRKAAFRAAAMKTKIFVLLLTGLLLGLPAYAQEARTLYLKDALNYALEANQSARKSRLDIEYGGYQIEEARARALPSINGSAAVTYNPILQMSVLPGEIIGQPGTDMLVAFGQKWNANAAVSFSQTLFDQTVFTGLKAARTTREFYQINADLTEEQIIEQVSTTYYRLQVQRRQVGVLDSTIKNTEKVLYILQNQYENGLARKVDVDRTEVSVSNLRTSRQQLINGVALLENQLKFLMGMPIQTPIHVPDASLKDITPRPVPRDAIVDVSNRTEIRLLNTQTQLLQYNKQAIQSGGYPSLSLSSAYSYQGLSNKFPIGRGMKDGANWFDVASVGVNLRIPIFNGFAVRSKVRQADVEIRKAQEDIAQTKLSLNLAFENARTQINNNIITLSQQQKNVALAEEVFSNTQNNYNNGLASLTDLLSAENALTEAQNNYATALLDYKVAEIQLLKSQGQLKTLINQ